MISLFSKHLRAIREEKNISQKELADKLFVSAQAVSKWERNKSSPNPETIAKIADILEVSADYLLERKDRIGQKEEKPTPEGGAGPALKKIALIQKNLALDNRQLEALTQVADSVLAKRDE